mmetsp:Transcript_20576/g.22986  ORF Transcript_20576/g.22986 Transcript_20576/m.22986 type:complete len:347 (+) Transcript_20576:250-1290(+)
MLRTLRKEKRRFSLFRSLWILFVVLGFLFCLYRMSQIFKWNYSLNEPTIMEDGPTQRKSKHPKWKLWEEMKDEDERNKAIEDIGVYIANIAKNMTDVVGIKYSHKCGTNGGITTLGLEGAHFLCEPKPIQPCFFLSAGIRDDTTMDIALADQWGCRGISVDPSIDHNSHLHPLVTFHNIALNTINGNVDMLDADRNDINHWLYASVPSLTNTFGVDYIDVLKLDCEGCEMAFPRDLLREDPYFLKRVSQITLETHISRIWVDTREQLYYLGLNFALLEEAGFKLIVANVFGCMKKHEKPGCRPEFKEWGYPCGKRKNPMFPKLGLSCQDFLFIHEDQMKQRMMTTE